MRSQSLLVYLYFCSHDLIYFIGLFSYADDISLGSGESYLFGPRAASAGPGLFGEPGASGASERSFARAPHSVRVVTVRVLTPAGVRAQLHPINSLHCSRLLNRIFGMILESGWRIVPAPVHEYFRVGWYFPCLFQFLLRESLLSLTFQSLAPLVIPYISK